VQVRTSRARTSRTERIGKPDSGRPRGGVCGAIVPATHFARLAADLRHGAGADVGVGELAYGLKCSARADDRVPNVRPRVESRTRESVCDSKCSRVSQRPLRTRGSSVSCPPFLLVALSVRHRQDEAVTRSRAESLAAHQERSSSERAVVRPLAGARVCCKAAERAAVSHAGACSRRRVLRRVCFPPSPPHQGTAPHTQDKRARGALADARLPAAAAAHDNADARHAVIAAGSRLCARALKRLRSERKKHRSPPAYAPCATVSAPSHGLCRRWRR
jgi:hypothetical protein